MSIIAESCHTLQSSLNKPPTAGRLAREIFSDIIVIHRSQDNDAMSVQKTAVNRGHSIIKWTGWSGGIENAHCILTDLISEMSRMPTGVVQGEEWRDPWGIYSLNLQWMSANHPGAGIVKRLWKADCRLPLPYLAFGDFESGTNTGNIINLLSFSNQNDRSPV